MNTHKQLKFTNLEFMILIADVLAYTRSNNHDPVLMLDMLCVGLDEIERAWIDIAQELTESSGTGCSIDGRLYEIVTLQVSIGQQIGLYIKESMSFAEEGSGETLQHWSDYPEEVLLNLFPILMRQVSTWYMLARDACLSDGSMITPLDRDHFDAS